MNHHRKVALVTGANKGIGYETARQLAKLGMTVLVGARDRERGETAVTALRAHGDFHLVVLDTSDAASIADAARGVERDIGHLDVLVNNAAIAKGVGPPPSAHSVPVMREVFETNFFGVVATTQAFLPLLRKSAAARIVNVTTSVGSLALASDHTHRIAQQSAAFGYAASKTALNAFTVRLAYELRETAIKVNTACPGFVATDLNQHRGVRSVEQGSAIIVRLATLPDDGATGGFFDDAGSVPW